MAIHRLLEGSAFAPDDIARLTSAYEEALRVLNLNDRADSLTEIVAKRIIEVAQTGVRDPARICRIALEGIERA